MTRRMAGVVVGVCARGFQLCQRSRGGWRVAGCCAQLVFAESLQGLKAMADAIRVVVCDCYRVSQPIAFSSTEIQALICL